VALFSTSCGRQGHIIVVLLVVILLVIVLVVVVQLVIFVFIVSRLVVDLLVVTLVLLVDSSAAPCTFGRLLVSVGRLTLSGGLGTGRFLRLGGIGVIVEGRKR
jgi:hypothetical protein